MLIEAGLVSVPDWLPAFVDDEIGPFPIVATSSHAGRSFFFVGWTKRDERRVTDLEIVGWEASGELSTAPGFSLDQLKLVMELVAELRPLLTKRALEGWGYSY